MRELVPDISVRFRTDGGKSRSVSGRKDKRVRRDRSDRKVIQKYEVCPRKEPDCVVSGPVNRNSSGVLIETDSCLQGKGLNRRVVKCSTDDEVER